MIVNIPLRYCEYLIYNNIYNTKISIITDIPQSNIELQHSYSLLHNIEFFDANIELLDANITQTNALIFCIWFINVLLFINISNNK